MDKNIFSKLNKVYYSLMFLIAIYASIKFSSIYGDNLSVLRNEHSILSEGIEKFNEVCKDYIKFRNISRIEEDNLKDLIRFIRDFQKKCSDVNKDNCIKLFNFLNYLDTININSSKTIHARDTNNFKLKELSNYSYNILNYKNFKEDISLAKEIKKFAHEYEDLTSDMKTRISIMGILSGISNRFINQLESMNNMDASLIEDIFQSADFFYYSRNEFKNLSLKELTSLKGFYSSCISETLQNQVVKKYNLPIINIEISKSIFDIVILISIIIFSFFLLIETLKISQINLEKNEIIHFYDYLPVIYVFTRIKYKINYSLNYYLLIVWSIINLVLPLVLMALFLFSNTSHTINITAEIIFIHIFAILYYSWVFNLNKLLIKNLSE